MELFLRFTKSLYCYTFSCIGGLGVLPAETGYFFQLFGELISNDFIRIGPISLPSLYEHFSDKEILILFVAIQYENSINSSICSVCVQNYFPEAYRQTCTIINNMFWQVFLQPNKCTEKCNKYLKYMFGVGSLLYEPSYSIPDIIQIWIVFAV